MTASMRPLLSVISALSVVLTPIVLAQAPRTTRVLIAVPDRTQAPAAFILDPQLSELLRGFGFKLDDRPAFRTCDAKPRFVIAGTIPTASMAALHSLLTARESPSFQLYDNPIVSSQYSNTCPRQADLGERHARSAAGLDINGLANGRGVVLAIVDGGIDMSPIVKRFPAVKANQIFSWPATPSPIYGSHGTLCAYVAALAAPAVEIADVRVFGDAFSFMHAYDYLRTTWNANRGKWKALVVSTSWEFPAPEPDFASKETLALGTTHPLLPTLRCLAGAGVDVVFAAGNSGTCGPSSNTARGSITPPNDMPEAITVAAVDGAKVRLGDSGQGGKSAPTKPDISAFGSLILQDGTYARHTSVATAFAAGINASLRSLDGWSAADRSATLVRKCFTEHADKQVKVVSSSGTLSSSQLTSHSADFGYGVMRLDSNVFSWKDTCGK